MTPAARAAIQTIAGRPIIAATELSGGCVGEVYRLALADGAMVVAKIGAGLEAEGFMLGYLAEHTALPVPKVLYSADDLLVMDWIDGRDGLPEEAQGDAAELLVALHSVTAPCYGLERDTVIGGLRQPNPWTERWLDFFRDQRLLYMAGEALVGGRLPPALMPRLERLAARLGEWIDEPELPSLIHGDAWSGNVLCRDGRVVAFIDPAIYFADAEIELAFGTLFGTFGQRFFQTYEALRPLRPGFWEARRELYNLYPLLVHVRLFGGSYVAQVEATLGRFGC